MQINKNDVKKSRIIFLSHIDFTQQVISSIKFMSKKTIAKWNNNLENYIDTNDRSKKLLVIIWEVNTINIITFIVCLIAIVIFT